MSALLAKRLGARKVIALINRQAYGELMPVSYTHLGRVGHDPADGLGGPGLGRGCGGGQRQGGKRQQAPGVFRCV